MMLHADQLQYSWLSTTFSYDLLYIGQGLNSASTGMERNQYGNRWEWITECTGAGGDGCKWCGNRRDESEILSLCRPLVDVCSKKQILCML